LGNVYVTLHKQQQILRNSDCTTRTKKTLDLLTTLYSQATGGRLPDIKLPENTYYIPEPQFTVQPETNQPETNQPETNQHETNQPQPENINEPGVEMKPLFKAP
jgi:hypothetical protein